MSEEKREVVQKQGFNTKLSYYTNQFIDLMKTDFQEAGIEFDDYSKQCVVAAMSSIYQLVQSNKADMNQLNNSTLRNVLGQVSSLRLNANAMPRECYFTLRKRQNANGQWEQVVELGIEGDGNDALLRQFGNEVDKVYPVWLVKEGDEFTYPKRKGIEVEPPTWNEKGVSQKVVRVVYPVKLKDGTIEYLIAERESVKTNLIAHIRNNMMNETFGFVTGKNSKGKDRTRYDATEEEKAKIKAKKNEIMEAVRKCETLEDMLNCEVAKPFISAAWLDTPEQMFVRKMRNNAIKKFPKNLNSMANSSLLQMDDTYKAAHDEITENENSQPFEVEGNVVAESEAIEIETPDFAKESE